MSEPFVGEIKMFAGGFAPRSYALCDGQLLAVSQNDALFSLFGTIYGGDGRTTFGLPDLRGRIPVHAGSGPGLTQRRLGQKAGSETVTLTTNQMPNHRHSVRASSQAGTSASPTGNYLAEEQANVYHAAPFSVSTKLLGAGMVANTGSSSSHSNLMPTLCINFIVALFGVYPSRA